MLVNRITLRRITIHIQEQLRKQQTTNSDLQIWVTVQIKQSFNFTQQKIVIPRQNNGPSEVNFKNQLQIFYQNADQQIRICVYGCVSQDNRLLAVADSNIKDLLQKQYLSLRSQSQSYSHNIGRIQYKIEKIGKKQYNILSLKNMLCELMQSQSKKIQYLLEIKCGNMYYRTSKYQNNLFWQHQIKMIIQNKQDSIIISLVDVKQRKRIIQNLKANIFRQNHGSKKIIITNQLAFPIGCLQLDYQALGFISDETQGDSNQDLKLVKQVYKIYFQKIKAKFRQIEQISHIKIVSDINYLDIQTQTVQNNELQVEINNYIYSYEPRCTLLISSKSQITEILGFSALKLSMLGKYQTRVGVVNDNKKQIGYLIVGMQAVKIPVKIIKLNLINLKLDRFAQVYKGDQIFMTAKIGGCFGKTQSKVINKQIHYSKALQVKYSNQQTLFLQINHTKSGNIISIPIVLFNLQKNYNGHLDILFGYSQQFAQGTLNFQYNYQTTAPVISNQNHTKAKIDHKQISSNIQKSKLQPKTTQAIAILQKLTMLQQLPNQAKEISKQSQAQSSNRDKQFYNKIPIENNLQQNSNQTITKALNQKINDLQQTQKNVGIVKRNIRQIILKDIVPIPEKHNNIFEVQLSHRIIRKRSNKSHTPLKLNISKGHRDKFIGTERTQNSRNKVNNSIKRYQVIFNAYIGHKIQKNTNKNINGQSKHKQHSHSVKKQVRDIIQYQLPKLRGMSTFNSNISGRYVIQNKNKIQQKKALKVKGNSDWIPKLIK